MSLIYSSLGSAIARSLKVLRLSGEVVDTGHWQGVPTGGKPDLETKELVNLSFTAPIPETARELQFECAPNLPWAEVEFLERVGGEPHNPHYSLDQWPWWHGQEGQTMYEGMFSHTYSERFWPKRAPSSTSRSPMWKGNFGIRYLYGDLNDVVNLLRKYPHTRQATFPIFFPEDTGAVHGGRIPCSLHYHFMLRNDQLNLWYPIRSCDAVRHFRDDVYMAGRLCQWVIEEIQQYPTGEEYYNWDGVVPGLLHFTAYSFHVHRGDEHLL